MDKPFKTIDEQIAILSSRGLATDARSRQILRREGYYCVINGYKDIFIDMGAKSAASGDDRYITGSSFDHIYRLFEFDRDLRLMMFKYFAKAEATLKTACSYCFAERYKDKSEPYLDKVLYRREPEYIVRIEKLIDDFNYILGRSSYTRPDFRRPYIEHYVNNHDEVPLWVLANYISLGSIFKFFTFQKESMRNDIARYFSTLYKETHDVEKRFNPEDVRLIYDHIKDFRNICAHDERLYCARVSPSKDVSFAQVVNDLSFVMQKDEEAAMRADVTKLILGVTRDIPLDISRKILGPMGLSSVNSLVTS